MGLKLDTARPGVWISGAAHAALLGAALVAFNAVPLPVADEGIPVEVITDNQLSEITKGELQAKEPKPNPQLRAERVAETRAERDPGEAPKDAPAPPKRPVEAKIDDDEVEAPTPPAPPQRTAEVKPEAAPPAPPRREPEKKPEPPKREDLARLVERQEAEAQARAEAQAKAEAASKAKAEAQAKAEAERQKSLAEAKAKAVADAKAKAKADAEAKAKRNAEVADKFDPGALRQLLASKEPAQSSGSTGREIQRTASLGTATGSAQKLNPSQRDQLMGLLRDQLHRCWQAPMAIEGAAKPPVPTVRLKLNQDGSLAAEPAVLNSSADPLFRVVAESATRATRRCAPLRIPAQFAPYYQDWKDLVVNFDPREMG